MERDGWTVRTKDRKCAAHLKKGMCIAIEPMITLGSRQIVMERDGWTVRTRDRKCAAHFEHTVAIGVGKADILSSFEYVEQVLGDKAI